MRKLCYELESGSHRAEVQKYRKLVEKIAKWHTDTVNQYSELLQYETSMTVLSTELAKAQDELDLSGDLSYNFGAKLAYFSIAEALIKLILSCYSYGPSREFFREHGFNDTLFDSIPDLKKDCTTPWLNVKYNSYHMTEIVAKVLRDDNICFDYDFVALLTERIIRNNLTHASEASKCLSAIRCYNCIRSMLVFLDQKYEDELRRFNFSVPFSFDDFLASPCDFNFENYTTILVVESVHDIRKDHRKVIANLPWDMVLDLDGCSDCGGLLSAVEHNRIMKSVLSTDSVKTVSFNRGETEWYRCGQYQQYNYIPRSDVVQIEIPAYNPFIVKPLVPNGGYQIREKYRETDLRSILRYIFKAAHKTDRPINIVAATDDFSIIKQIINTFHAEDIHEFFLTWVGITANSEAPNNILDSDEVGKNFAHFCCQSEQFFREFADRQAMFSVRTSIISSFSLMTKDGLVQIGENHRHNLSSCFEPLFDGCEMLEPELQDEARNSFYKGNSVASWYVIANQHAVQIRRPDEYKQLMDKIGSYLGVLQIKAQKRLFFIKHRPGIGGSTFVRQLAWDLHKSYTVLYVKHYESGQIVKLIEDLYDNVLNKSPIVLVADDTLTSVKSLCDDVMRIERRCMLIISCRNTNNLISLYQDSEQYALLSLPDTVIGQLRLKYQNVSNLPVSTLRERDAHFYENIQRDMNTPFIIGLYYLEKDYNVKSYVEKIFRECAERRYLDLLAYLAMFDRYNYKNVPASFVRSVLGLKPRDEILNIVPSISSLITKDASQTDSYRFKHNLLSSSYLSSYCQRFFENSIADMIYSLTKSIITIVAAMYSQNKLTDGHLNMLISVIIQNRNDYDTELEDLNLSTLLREVVRPEKQRSILEMLYNHFVSVADSYVEDDEISDNNLVMHLIRRLVSHACAHLGRMYSRGEQNYKLAREWIERGIQYVPDQDPDIFHMAGTITMDELRSCWKKDLDMLGMNSIERSKLISEQSQYENSLAQAESYFEKACDYGSPDYGYPSMLALYFHYLKYIFELKKIENVRDIDSKLSLYQRELISRFLSILDNAKTYEGLDEKALSKINYYEGAFYSKIMFEDSGNEVQYYHNRYEQLKEKSTILEWRVALKGLIQARLHAVTNRKNGHVDYRAVKDPKGLMEHIELLLQTPLEEQFSYFDYMQKNRLFHHWIQLAKVVEKPLDKVKVQLIYWVEMEEQKKKNYNPEPYYYLRAVCYLLALEGYAKEIEYAREYDRKIHEYDRANLFSSILANRYVLRDIIVEGRGMSKLVDVTNVSAQEYVGYLHSIKKKPMLIQGHIRGAMNQSTLLADAFQPIEWNTNIEFRIDIGKKTTNSLTEKQVGHTVRYYAGFSINHPMAVSDLIRDIDAGESLDWSDLSQTIEQSVPTQKERKGKDDPQSKVDHPKKKTFSPVKVTPVKEPKQVSEISMKAVADNALPDLRKQIVSVTIHDAGGKNPVGFFIYNGCEYRIKVVMINGKKAEKVIKDAIESKRSIRVTILQNSQEDGFYVGKLST